MCFFHGLQTLCYLVLHSCEYFPGRKWPFLEAMVIYKEVNDLLIAPSHWRSIGAVGGQKGLVARGTGLREAV
jgi:hypothetical protein